MKKKELLAMTQLNVTNKMSEIVHNDEGVWMGSKYFKNEGYTEYEYYRFYRARVENEILKIAIFTRIHIAEDIKEPDFEVYIDKKNEEWATYEPSTEKWYTAKIENLQYAIEDGGWKTNYKAYETGITRKIVNEYFETNQNLSVKAAVLDFQNNIRNEELKRRHRSELEQIDEVMNEVPELPKDFQSWIENKGFLQQRYLLYKRERNKTKTYCTHCNAWTETKDKLQHNSEGKCNNCGSYITIKAYGKQKEIFDRKPIGIIQRLNDNSGYIHRIFDVWINYKKEKEYKKDIVISEVKRYRLDEYFTKRESFEWAEYKNKGEMRWCHESYNYHGYYSYSDSCVLYSRNLVRTLRDSEIKYIPFTKLMKHKEGKTIRTIDTLESLRENKEYEMLIKMNLVELTWNLLERPKHGIKVYKNEKTPWKYLGITKEYMKMIIKMNATADELKVIQVAQDVNTKVNEEQIHYFKKFPSQQYKKILQLGHIEKFMKYFKEELGVVEGSKKDLKDYIDYLADCEALRYEITKQQLFPKNFQHVHHEVAVQRQEKEDRDKKADIRKKNRVLKNMLKDLKPIYEAEDDKYKLILPSCKGDFIKEGQQQHNCVGGSYFDKMIQGKCVVAFLRIKENLDKSFCTVEFSNNGTVLQNKTYCNKEAPKEAEEFIKEVEKKAIRILSEREKEKYEKTRVQIAI